MANQGPEALGNSGLWYLKWSTTVFGLHNISLSAFSHPQSIFSTCRKIRNQFCLLLLLCAFLVQLSVLTPAIRMLSRQFREVQPLCSLLVCRRIIRHSSGSKWAILQVAMRFWPQLVPYFRFYSSFADDTSRSSELCLATSSSFRPALILFCHRIAIIRTLFFAVRILDDTLPFLTNFDRNFSLRYCSNVCWAIRHILIVCWHSLSRFFLHSRYIGMVHIWWSTYPIYNPPSSWASATNLTVPESYFVLEPRLSELSEAGKPGVRGVFHVEFNCEL